MEQFRAVYLMAGDSEFARWVQGLWSDTLPADDILNRLLRPHDLRGEVAAWGGVHWTILDALTVNDTAEFDNVVRDLCARSAQPTLSIDRPSMIGNSTLAVRCHSPELDELRMSLINTTRRLLVRSVLADEEWQHAEWWITLRLKHPDANIAIAGLRECRAWYRAAGSPPLPSSRHFRLGYLLRLFEKSSKSDAHLQYFAEYGEPFWYGTRDVWHTSIASGLDIARKLIPPPSLEEFLRDLAPEVQRKLGPIYHPTAVAIMGEDREQIVHVRVFDWLTHTYVEENRPALRVLEMMPFRCNATNICDWDQ